LKVITVSSKMKVEKIAMLRNIDATWALKPSISAWVYAAESSYSLMKKGGIKKPSVMPRVIEAVPIIVVYERSLSANQFDVTLAGALYMNGQDMAQNI